MILKDKVAIITGGSRGIGACISRRFGAEGAHVAVVSNSRPDKAKEVVNEITLAGGVANSFQADISKIDNCASLVKAVEFSLGSVDILVNNAGIYIPLPIEETTENDWDQQFDTNLKGCFFMTKAVLPKMKNKRSGKIINVASSFGLVGAANASAYCASKGGLINLTRALCLELAPYGINVNALAPGGAETDMNKSQREIPGFVDKANAATPSGNYFMDADDLSGAAVFLASSDSNSVHGAHIVVDGGWTAA